MTGIPQNENKKTQSEGEFCDECKDGNDSKDMDKSLPIDILPWSEQHVLFDFPKVLHFRELLDGIISGSKK